MKSTFARQAGARRFAVSSARLHACIRAGLIVCAFGQGSPPAVSGVRACLRGPLPLEPGGRGDVARMKLETHKASADERGFLTACETVACVGMCELRSDIEQEGSRMSACVRRCLPVVC